MKLLKVGLQYCIEKPLTTYSTNLIMETENATKVLDKKLQNPHRILTTKQLKQNLNSNNSYNIQHKTTLCHKATKTKTCNRKCNTSSSR